MKLRAGNLVLVAFAQMISLAHAGQKPMLNDMLGLHSLT